MPSFPRLRMDVALGLLAIGTVWYILTRKNEDPSPDDEPSIDATPQVIPGSMEVLSPLLTDPALFEKIMLSSDPQTILRTAQISKYHNEAITTSSSLQLLLRAYYHQIPPVKRPSALERKYLLQPKKRQLDDLIGREERLSRFRHTKFQRCSMPYIDVLCSGDYTVVTRCLSGRTKVEGVPESGPVEDGYTVMVPLEGQEGIAGKTEEDVQENEDEGERKARRVLKGYAQRTVDVGGEIADIGVRADEDLIVLATIVPEEDVIPQGPDDKPQVVRVEFFHLETFTPRSPDSEIATPIRHSQAKLQTAEFAFDTSFTSIRIRAGPEGRLLIWAKDDGDKSQTTAMIYDWKLGKTLGYAWSSDSPLGGIPHDFSFFTPDVLLIAVLKTVNKGRDAWTPTARSAEPTRLEIQTWRLPDLTLSSTSHKRVSVANPNDEAAEPNGFDHTSLAPCRLIAIYMLPAFTYKWKNPQPMEDEIPSDVGQTFNLFHCSVAAKPSPLSYESNAREGILCVTIEGDFGPFTHPQGDPHDHGAIAFCTISGAAFNPPRILSTAAHPQVYEYEEWQEGNVAWDFGPHNTWITGFGTRTALVTRYIGFQQELDAAGNWEEENPNRVAIMKLTLRNYDPVTVAQRGQIHRHPLGRPQDPVVDAEAIKKEADVRAAAREAEEIFSTNTAHVNGHGPGAGLDDLFLPAGLDQLLNMALPPFAFPGAPAPGQAGPPNPMQNPFLNPAPPAPGPGPGAAGGPPPGAAQMAQFNMTEILRSMESASSMRTTYKVVKAIDHGIRPEIFGDKTHLRTSIPYFESNVTIPIPDGEDDRNERGEAGMDHPFKTILARDRLIVCDDGGFDILNI